MIRKFSDLDSSIPRFDFPPQHKETSIVEELGALQLRSWQLFAAVVAGIAILGT